MHSKHSFTRLGVAAYLSAKGSVHRDTFIRAIKMAEQDLQQGARVQLTWENDRASFTGGRTAAKRLAKTGAHLVVGHYASAAASGALPVYQKAQIPVLLPAATAPHLTAEYDYAFRLCCNDHSLAGFIFNTIHTTTRYRTLTILHDDSAHGHSLSNALCSAFSDTSYIINSTIEPDAVIFVGSFRNSLLFLHNFRREGHTCPVYFTDDAVHQDIVQQTDCTTDKLFIFGYAPSNWYDGASTLNEAYYALYNQYPPTYFLETYAAMQIAYELASDICTGRDLHAQICGRTWQTVLGNIRFKAGECEVSRFALWKITSQNQLVPDK